MPWNIKLLNFIVSHLKTGTSDQWPSDRATESCTSRVGSV